MQLRGRGLWVRGSPALPQHMGNSFTEFPNPGAALGEQTHRASVPAEEKGSSFPPSLPFCALFPTGNVPLQRDELLEQWGLQHPEVGGRRLFPTGAAGRDQLPIKIQTKR